LITLAACLLLGFTAEAGPFGKDRGFARDNSFSRADNNRDGFICEKEYRNFHREGSRGDFFRRDLNRDNRLSRDEWSPFDSRNDRWPPRR
jgi:hypothetical protein